MSSPFVPVKAQLLSGVFQRTELLNDLLQHAKRLGILQTQLDYYLEPAARPYCKVASFQEGCLLLIVTNANWATRIRYRQQRLLSQLQALPEYRGLARIALKILPQPEEPAPPPPLVLPPHTAKLLQETAEGIQDPTLRAALERLAQRTRPRS